MVSDLLGLFGGAVALGFVHGVEPGHGWPIAASYAMEKRRKWLYGAAAGTILGLGHLVSSIAMVVVFFAAKSYFELTQLSWLPQVAGVLLILLGLNELRGDGHHHDHGEAGQSRDEESFGRDEHGVFQGRVGGFDHSRTLGGDGNGEHAGGDKHAHDDGHAHTHGDEHSHAHDHGGVSARLKSALPFVGGHSHGHAHELGSDPSQTSLWSIAWFAFLLGFAHEEEFEIILLCTGSNYCLELMTAYALTVVVGIVALTLVLVAGYYRYEERMKAVAEHFPTISAAILILMGLGFVFGVF